jgi:hypothetical protein
MNSEGTVRVNPSCTAFEEQLEYESACKTYTARCAVCGNAKTEKKPWYRSHDRTKDKLRLNFNFCTSCNEWVCEDCFYIDDGYGRSIDICIPCAKERGETGLTLAQSEEAKSKEQRANSK